jgi:hypothetical protein
MLTDNEKCELAFKDVWPVEVAAEYFDISEDDARRLAVVGTGATLSRFLLEQKLVYEERMGLDWLALEFGLTRTDLEAIMRRPPTGHAPFPLDTYASQHRFLLPRKLAVAWIRELLPKHKVWSSLDARTRDLANVIQKSVRECVVSQRFNESPAAVATCRCIVTWDAVSRAHQEYVANSKPLPLEPDHVGWHAIFDGKIDRAQLFRTDLTNMNRYVAELHVA